MEEASQITVSDHFGEAKCHEPLTNGPFQHFSVTLSLRQTQSRYIVTF